MKELWRGETGEFQPWVVKNIEAYGGQAQPITGDDKYPGIPDLSIAARKKDIWAELKLYRPEQDLDTKFSEMVRKGRELTAQQYKWLLDRAYFGSSIAGVLFAWRTADIQFITFLPIFEWRPAMSFSTLRVIADSKYTRRVYVKDVDGGIADLIISSCH